MYDILYFEHNTAEVLHDIAVDVRDLVTIESLGKFINKLVDLLEKNETQTKSDYLTIIMFRWIAEDMRKALIVYEEDNNDSDLDI